MLKILVTDGEQRAALAAVQSLGRHGYRVMVASSRPRSLAACSKFCLKAFRVPDPMSSGADYAGTIARVAGSEDIDIVLPMTDVSIALLGDASAMRSVSALVACPPGPIVAQVSDKVNLFRIAERLGVQMPRTLFIEEPETIERRIGEITTYPVVVKPAKSVIPAGTGFVGGNVCYARNPEELRRLYAALPALRWPSLIQEKIVGDGTGLFTLFDRDRHLALFSHRRVREKPPSGGVSVVSESVPLDEEMVAAAQRLLSAVQWQGVAMVEFKRDRRDGRAKLMEINGRLWGSLKLATACGIDFPTLYLDYLQGRQFDAVIRNYRIGRKLKWFFGTLDHLIILLRGKPGGMDPLVSGSSKLRAVAQFARIWEKDTTFDVFDAEDTAPFRFETGRYFREIFHKWL